MPDGYKRGVAQRYRRTAPRLPRSRHRPVASNGGKPTGKLDSQLCARSIRLRDFMPSSPGIRAIDRTDTRTLGTCMAAVRSVGIEWRGPPCDEL
jgi:hypothetical protein